MMELAVTSWSALDRESQQKSVASGSICQPIAAETSIIPLLSELFQGSGKIGDEIVGIFDSHRIAYQVVFDADHEPLLGR